MAHSSNIDYVVFIGRFQPYHLGHEDTVRRALEKGKHVVIVIGSSHRPRTPKNPWTAREREQMIRSTLSDEDNDRLSVRYIQDRYDSEAWAKDVNDAVEHVIQERGGSVEDSVVRIIGREKDSSTYYLRIFPQWTPVLEINSCDSLSATELRDFLFLGGSGGLSFLKANVPLSVYQMMETFKTYSLAYPNLQSDAEIVFEKRAVNNTASQYIHAVLLWNGAVLLRRRQQAPGVGLWSLPCRLLEDEGVAGGVQTILKDVGASFNESVDSRIYKTKIFDNPSRSDYEKAISFAVSLKLTDSEVQSIDLKEFKWMPLDEVALLKEHMFEDNSHIIEKLV